MVNYRRTLSFVEAPRLGVRLIVFTERTPNTLFRRFGRVFLRRFLLLSAASKMAAEINKEVISALPH